MKLVWSWWGSNNNIALGVYAPTFEAAEQVFNCCYNYGAVPIDGQFHVLKDDKFGCFGYFKTSWHDLLKINELALFKTILPRTQKEIDESREDFFRE